MTASSKGGRGAAKAIDAQVRDAEKREAEAAKAGALGTYGTAEQRQLRRGAIVAWHLAGMQQKAIADRLQVSASTVERAIREFREMPSVLDSDPTEIIEDQLRALAYEAAQFIEMATRTEPRFPAVAVSARRAATEVRQRQMEVLAQTGKLAKRLSTIRGEEQLKRVTEAILDAVDRLERGDMTAAEVREAVLSAAGIEP